MKIIILLLIMFHISYFIFHASIAGAQTPTKTSDIGDIKDQLIETIASRVAQLNLVEKRSVVGTVTEASNTQITLSDIQNNTRFIDVDELTKFSSQDEDSFGISDITNGTTMSALGLYNKDSRRLLARFVDVVTLPMYIHGEAANIDKTNRVFDVIQKNGETAKIDFLNSTSIRSYTKTEDLTRSQFSAIQEGQRIIVTGSPDEDNEELITAERIILFPEIPSTIRINSEAASSATQSAIEN
ncbi:MAG: hypothetical protein ACD_50C00340G0002 [uncultured bacterium]|nr:MAG: hypothetical protein ACD_50C00340G0002 [uncultured bacterium]